MLPVASLLLLLLLLGRPGASFAAVCTIISHSSVLMAS
jgi:hypothetical protein